MRHFAQEPLTLVFSIGCLKISLKEISCSLSLSTTDTVWIFVTFQQHEVYVTVKYGNRRNVF
jgi:hypothetical protein